MNLDQNTEHNMLDKALKLYEVGKENLKKDEKLAKKCLELSLSTLNKLQNSNNTAQYMQLIQTTEGECMKMLDLKKQPNIFILIDRNDIDTIKELKYINFREINEKGNTILHHAIDIGDMGIIKELLKKGGMIDSVNGNGHTLLEYACLKKDPNIINFLVRHGSSMAKHLFFRKGSNKYYLNKPDIDMAILLKLIISNMNDEIDISPKFVFLEKYVNINDLIGLDKFTIRNMLNGLHYMFNNKDSYETYKKILIEELENYEQYKTVNVCIYNKIDIILSNLVPFINYPFNITSTFIIKNEIKNIIRNILKNDKKEYKKLLLSKLFDTYIQTNLFPEDYIGIIVYNILSKINISKIIF